MADVVLNLIYNDNGAGKNVDNLINSLKQMESKRYRISLDYAPVQSLTTEIEKATQAFEKLRQKSVNMGGAFGKAGAFNLNFDSATQSLEHFSSSLERAKREYNNLQLEARAVNNIINSLPEGDDRNKFSDKLDKLKNSIKGVVQDIELYKEAVNVAELAQKKIGQKFDVSGAENSINTLINKVISLQEAYQSRDFLGTFSFSKGPVGSQGQRGLAALTSGFYYNPTEEEKEQQRREESAKRMQEYDDANRQRMLNYERAQERHNNIIEQRRKEQEEFEKRQAERAKQQAEDQKKRTEEQVRQEQEAARQINETKSQIEKEEKERNDRMAEGNRKYWQGLSQVINGSIRLIEDSYNGLKATMMAPLNLTGVSTVASMLESMEGSLLLNQISSNITTGFSQGVERYDILNTYPAVIEHLGYSSEEANASLDKLYQSVLGLPTAFSDIVENAQQFTLLLDDLDRATDLAIAANNAFVASGAEPGMVSVGMRQIQYLLEGTKLRNTQWYSLIRSMPIALKEVGKNLGYENFTEFTAALREGNIESEILIDNLIEVGLHSESLGNILETMKSRVTASLTNVRNAATRLGDTLLETLDKTLQREGGKGLTENIRGVSGIIDHIAEVASQWISDHGPELQALLDKFFNIDWASVVPGFLEGLVDVANKALDNIGTWIEDIGRIITSVRTLFNDIENSQLFVGFKNGMSILGDVGSILGGFALLKSGLEKGGSFGGALSSWFGGSAASTAVSAVSEGGKISSFLGYIPQMAVLLGSILAVVETIAWDKSQREENEKFVSEQETKNEVDRLVLQYENAVREGNYGLANAAADNVYAYTGQSLVLPYVYSEEDVASALSVTSAYHQSGAIETALRNRSYADMLRSELESAASSIPEDLYEAWDKVWEGYQNRLDEVTERADRVSEKLKELRDEADKWVDTTVEDMAKIYGGKDGKGGKFLSEQVKETFGGLYRNTTNDFIMTQENAGSAMASVNDKIMEAIANMPESERAKAYEAWADYLGTFDFTDRTKLAQLEQMGKETGEQLVNTFLLPRDKADEVLNENNKSTKEMREGALTAAGAELNSEEEQILKEAGDNPVFSAIGQQLVDWADDMSDTYLPLIQDSLGMFSDDVVRAIQEMVNRINERRFYVNPRVVYNEQPGWVSPEGYHAAGGWISKGTDTVPAMLTPGEYVQRRAAVEHFGRQFMERINNLDLRGALRSISMNYATPYATGGFVRSDNRSYRDNHATVNQIFKSANASTGFRRASRFVRALG